MLFRLVGAGNPGNADAVLESNQASAYLGLSLAAAGNVNGDAYADVIVGAPGYDSGQTDEGAAFVFLGGGSGVGSGDPSNADSQLESDQASALLGFQEGVAGVGDVNGDGYGDVLVGATSYDNGQTDEGAAFLFLGSSTGVADGTPATSTALFESDQASASLGVVSRAGDVNGDGYADFAVVAPGYDAGQTDEAAVFVFLGNDNTDGRAVLPRQLRGDNSGIAVQPWGKSASGTAFKVTASASHPQGKGRVRLQIQTCAAGLPFGNGSCTTTNGSWTAVGGGSPEVQLTETVSGLSSGTLYRWRVRVQHAPVAGTIPSNPDHGPWLRVSGQASEADVRATP